MINLVKNAVKFTPRDGSITIKASYNWRHDCLVIHVKDTGAGIAQQDLPKLFSKFGKLHRTAEMNHEGIGLGLTIVKQIVHKHNGQIDVESDGPGKGSIFIITMKMEAVS